MGFKYLNPGKALTVGTIAVLASLLAFAASSVAAPVLFWTSDPVEPDETVMVTRFDLDTTRSVRVSRLGDDADTSLPASSALEAEVVQVSAHALKFVIPRGLKRGIFRYEINNSHGTATGFVNTPKIYWVQGDAGLHASQGGAIRVFGRDISRSTGAILKLTDVHGYPTRLMSIKADLWSAMFPVPNGLPDGRFNLSLWNGQGDVSAWRAAGQIEIKRAAPLPPYVETVLSPRPSVKRDDGNAIRQALASVAEHGGGTVALQRGYYHMSGTIDVPPHVSLTGEGMDLVSLVWPDVPDPPPVLISGHSDVSVQALTIASGRHRDIIRAGFPRSPEEADGSNIHLVNIRIRASAFLGHITPQDAQDRLNAMLRSDRDGVVSVALAGSNIVMEGCDIYGSMRSLLLVRPRGARIDRNIFYNGRKGWYSVSGADGVVFEGNEISGSDMEATGGGINTLFAKSAFSQNVLFRGNVFQNMPGWDQEALTTDGPGGFYYGPVSYESRADESILTLPDPAPNAPPNWKGAGVLVLGGRGMGEYAQVSTRTGATVHLDRALPVAPDSTSIVTIVPMQKHYLILDNTFKDAGVAVQIYGTGVDHVIANNTSIRTGGFVNWGLVYGAVQPSWYNQFLNNVIASSASTKPSLMELRGDQNDQSHDVLNFGSILRGNRLHGNSLLDIRASVNVLNLPASSPGAPALSDALIEHNSGENRQPILNGLNHMRGVADVFTRENEFGVRVK